MSGGSSKRLCCRVILLDESDQSHELQRKALGLDLYNVVYEHLQLTETDYFGLQFLSIDNKEWLDKEKTILSQCRPSNLTDKEVTFSLRVKFYTPEPTLLEHDLTRYMYAQQVRHDLVSGHLDCNENTASILASYIVQSVIGDFYYQPNDHHSYLKSLKLLPNQSDEIEDKIAEYHKALKGLSVAEAEFQLLDVARKTEKYGVIPHTCLNSDGSSVQLAVTHTGIHVYMNSIRTCSYIWVRIRKLGFKRRRFVIKLYPTGEKKLEITQTDFAFSSRDSAKSFWKTAVENHSFFRKLEVRPRRKRSRGTLLSSGSSFRYSGRTQTQLVEQMKQKWGQSTFDRSMSLRNFSSTSAGHRFGTTRSATFNNRQDLGTMTLDRRGLASAAPTASQATLESRYSGSYDTEVSSNQPPTSLTISNSLSAISSLTKSNGKFDLKSSTAFLSASGTGSREGGSNRDSMAVVEDNRQELERLVELINSDLSTAAEQNAAELSPKTPTESTINQLLSSKPNISSANTQNKLTVPAQATAGASVKSDCPTQQEDSAVKSQETTCHAVSDEETLNILLTDNVKDSPVTDLDLEHPRKSANPSQSEKEVSSSSQNSMNNGAQITYPKHGQEILSSPELVVSNSDDVIGNDITVNDVLDQVGEAVDETILLSIDEKNLNSAKENHSSPHKAGGTAVDTGGGVKITDDVIVLSAPEPQDYNVVYRSALDFSVASLSPDGAAQAPGGAALSTARRGRIRSRQEQIEDLTQLSELADQVFSDSAPSFQKSPPPTSQRSQEISDLASHVLDFCGDTSSSPKPQLADLSDLLAHYDTIKQQQKSIHQSRAAVNSQSNKVTTRTNQQSDKPRDPTPTQRHDISGVPQRNNGNASEIFFQPAAEKSKRKPLIRPALPVLTSPKERLLDWNFATRSNEPQEVKVNSDKSNSINNRMVDSGIEVSQPIYSNKSAVLSHPSFKTDQSLNNMLTVDQSDMGAFQLSDQSQPLSSDGYSSDSDDVTGHDTSSQVISNPMVHV